MSNEQTDRIWSAYFAVNPYAWRPAAQALEARAMGGIVDQLQDLLVALAAVPCTGCGHVAAEHTGALRECGVPSPSGPAGMCPCLDFVPPVMVAAPRACPACGHRHVAVCLALVDRPDLHGTGVCLCHGVPAS